MKRIASTFITALFAGAITLGGAYKLFFEKPNYTIVSDNESGPPVFNTSYTPTSARGAGINEVDFTIAAEMTVNAVVHVKNVTMSRGSSSYLDFFYGHGGNSRPPQVVPVRGSLFLKTVILLPTIT